MRHQQARMTARTLYEAYDGSAEAIVSHKVDRKIATGDVTAALQLDQVRREILKIYDEEGE